MISDSQRWEILVHSVVSDTRVSTVVPAYSAVRTIAEGGQRPGAEMPLRGDSGSSTGGAVVLE